MIAAEQVPAIYRRMVGGVLVTAINDGFIVFPPGILQNVTPAETEGLLRAAGRRPPFATPINVFLLQWPDRTVLIDAGGGTMVGPSLGRLVRNLEEAGCAVTDVDAILMTHLHSDHVGGLVDATGEPAFPQAELLVPEVEMAFWLDDAQMEAAPEARRASFQAARDTTSAYADRLTRFAGTAPLPGVEAVFLPGHTPGHTGYVIGSETDRLLIWGDVVHIAEVQSARPNATLPFDSDPALAAKTRHDIFEKAASEDLLVAGMHMNFPAFARVARAGDGFVVQPEVWREEL